MSSAILSLSKDGERLVLVLVQVVVTVGMLVGQVVMAMLVGC